MTFCIFYVIILSIGGKMNRLEKLLNFYENGSNYSKKSWGGEKEAFYEKIVSERNKVVTLVFDAVDPKEISRLDDIYNLKTKIMNRLKEDPKIEYWVSENISCTQTH